VLLHHGGTSRVGAPVTHRTTTTTSTTTPANVTTTTTVALRAPSTIKVQVLNGVLAGNLATQFSQQLHTTSGYNVLAPDDATAKVLTSMVYMLTQGYNGEADALAKSLGLSTSAVNTTVPPPATAPIPARDKAAANLVVVIGPDLAGKS
nr:LytR C-terminal domain-containing protein [Actinomycetota bacterium]